MRQYQQQAADKIQEGGRCLRELPEPGQPGSKRRSARTAVPAAVLKLVGSAATTSAAVAATLYR